MACGSSAHLYRKRTLQISTELDERLSGDVKQRFLVFLSRCQHVTRENEALFLRNVVLTKETLQYKTEADECRREKERCEKETRDMTHRCEAAERELDELKKRLSRQEREEEVRRRKEAARALQIKTENLSKSWLKGGQAPLSLEPEEKERGNNADVSTSPYTLQSPSSPRSPAFLLSQSPSTPRRSPLSSHILLVCPLQGVRLW